MHIKIKSAWTKELSTEFQQLKFRTEKNSGYFFITILYIVFTLFHFKTINHRFNRCWYHLKLNTCKQYIHSPSICLLLYLAKPQRDSLTDACHPYTTHNKAPGFNNTCLSSSVCLFFLLCFVVVYEKTKIEEEKKINNTENNSHIKGWKEHQEGKGKQANRNDMER